MLTLAAGLACLISGQPAAAQSDPGKAVIGNVEITVYHATDGDPDAAGEKATGASKEIETRLRGSTKCVLYGLKALQAYLAHFLFCLTREATI